MRENGSRARHLLEFSLVVSVLLCQSVVSAGSDHSAPAGLRWQVKDDTGWSAQYERLGIKGTIKEQTLITFVEVVDSEFIDDSVLEVFVTQEGQVKAKRQKIGESRNCLYTGQIKNAPTILDRGFSLKNRTNEVGGSYTCETEPKSGEWSGTIFW